MKYVGTLIISTFVFILMLAGSAWSQECGPGCPACSGKTTGDLISSRSILGSWLYIPDGEEDTSVFRISGGLFSWMDVGIGYAVDSEKTIWSLRVQPVAQDQEGWRPAVTVGVGSVQTGGSDQSDAAQGPLREEGSAGATVESLRRPSPWRSWIPSSASSSAR